MPVKLRHICHHCSTHDQSGSAIVEMALVLPIFIFLFIAIVDFGLYFNARNVAHSAAWNGAKEYVASNSSANVTSVVRATLDPLLSDDALALITPTSTTTSSGGANYTVTQVIVAGNMLSPFTTSLGLYPITAIGIAN
jgi:Flp pilus assembly protein TadG